MEDLITLTLACKITIIIELKTNRWCFDSAAFYSRIQQAGHALWVWFIPSEAEYKDNTPLWLTGGCAGV